MTVGGFLSKLAPAVVSSGQWTTQWETPGGSTATRDTSMGLPVLVTVCAVVASLRRPMRAFVSRRIQVGGETDMVDTQWLDP